MSYKSTVATVAEGGTGLATLTSNSIQIGNGTSTVTQLATANSGVLTTDSSGVPSIDTTNFARQTTGMQMKGNNTNTAPPAGFIGEILTNSATAVAMTSNSATNITSVTLTAGIWDIEGALAVVPTGGAGVGSQVYAQLTSSSATISGNLGVDYNRIAITANFALMSLNPPKVRATLSGNTIYYLVGQHVYSSTTGPGNGLISATRVG